MAGTAFTINLESYGFACPGFEGFESTISIGGHPACKTQKPGVTMAIFDPIRGILTIDNNFNNKQLNLLRSFLSNLSPGTVVVAVTYDEAPKNIKNAQHEFATLGIDLSSFEEGDKFAFAALVNSPTSHRMCLVKAHDKDTANLTVTVTRGPGGVTLT